MPWTWKARDRHRRRSHGRFTVHRTERAFAPDRIDRITLRWLGKIITIWERS